MVVRRSGLLTALIALFEQYFEKGWQLRPAGPGQTDDPDDIGPAQLDAIDWKILALLRVGLTDAAIARQLNTSHRTVQRRLHHMRDSFGLATRFQLGWYIAVSGRLDQNTPSHWGGSPAPAHLPRPPA
ncbi:helix-turn-helix transcriptional regulator [Streptomyces sp. NPDC005318]|uniref:helix-turn-helix domain-containing protein n=1 Tax=Streptomyces sp. NPDC005318 TaxID=3157031 RepID=UPI0033A6E4D3